MWNLADDIRYPVRNTPVLVGDDARTGGKSDYVAQWM